MTHDGPQDSFTALADNTISMPGDAYGMHKFGSAGLHDLIKANEDKLVVHIHGHCHDGAFTDRVAGQNGGFPIINPGSLNQREYGVLTLVKHGEKW